MILCDNASLLTDDNSFLTDDNSLTNPTSVLTSEDEDFSEAAAGKWREPKGEIHETEGLDVSRNPKEKVKKPQN